jgi:hypothetical protein
MSSTRVLAILAILAAGCGGAPERVAAGFVPASHPSLPQVQSAGGSVLFEPKVQPIFYDGDDPQRAGLEGFLRTFAATTWGEQTAEYQVGPLAVLPTIVLPGPAPAALTDDAVKQTLASSTAGPSPAWGAAEASTIYLFFTPPGATVTWMGDQTSCADFDAFHGEDDLGEVPVPYIVGAACPGYDGPTVNDLQERTIAVSHELLEAATDPFPDTDPAYDGEDPANAVWTLGAGGEIADLCMFELDPYTALPDGSFVQRSWSNQAAAAGTNPCVPAPPGKPYFNAAPDLPDTLSVAGISMPGVVIPVGASRTISLHLFSDAPTPGPWTVTAMDVNELDGGPARLSFSQTPTSGQNGDVLSLTITVLSADPASGIEPFLLVSDLDGDSSLWMGAVGQ